MKYLDIIKNFFIANTFNIIMFFVVLIAGLIIVKIVLSTLRRVFKKTKLAPALSGFLISIIKFILLLIYFLTLASIIGVPITSLIAIATAVSLAITLAIQGTIANLANGIIILGSKPFKVGDYIEIAGVSGTVQTIKMVSTVILTPNNQVITVPHNKTVADVIVNYSTKENRRIELIISVDYQADIEQVKNVISAVSENHPNILKDKDRLIRLAKCSASSLDFTLKVWTKTEDYWSTYYDLNERIVKALRENNIQIPYQTIDININEKNRQI